MARELKEPADILKLPAIIDGRAMFSWEVWMREAGLSGSTAVTRHVFNDASLCLDAAVAGQGVMLAWQTLAGYSLQAGQLAAPFGIRARTGFGHYFITAEGAREPKQVREFKDWVRAEMLETLAFFP
jgi:DNA-binding transcriptional LysR family regulator